ncbi:MAG: alpha-L-arabinofuranosidase C-terminal domain-containing protein, partial [Pyrinomonadaceae bacterium]
VASRAADGRRVFINAVNTDPARALVTTINVSGARVGPRAEVQTITADSLKAANDFATPDAVRVTRSAVRAGRRFVVTLPKHSVSVISFDVMK